MTSGATPGFEFVGGVDEPAMRNTCPQQQQQQKKKDLSVYDFNADDSAVEAASAKYSTRTGRIFPVASPKSNLKEERKEALKYNFLQAFTSLDCMNMDANEMPCIDVCESGSPQNSSGIDSPERILDTTGEKCGMVRMDENMTESYQKNGNECLARLDPETLVPVEPFVTVATGLVVRNVQVANLQSDGKSADVISDEDGSSRSGFESASASASDHVADEDYVEHPLSENYFVAPGEKDKDDLAVILSPDYVIYKNAVYVEAELSLFSDSILFKCWDANENNENFVLEWTISDIIHIECEFGSSVRSTLVKFHIRATTVTVNENIHDNCDDVDLIVAVSDMQWREKELKIKCLAERYKDIWSVPNDVCSASEDDTMARQRFFPGHYFTETPDSFEDVIYPKGDPDAVAISKRDIELLQPDTFINDTIIDFYIKYLKTKIPPNERHRFHFFNSFFFRKLADLDMDPESASEGRAAFLRVRKWTRKVNIFEKDYIFIPVNFNLHWSLLVICHPGEVSVLKDDDVKDSPKVPCILHMDSIRGSHAGLKNLVQSYLLEEWKERHPESAEDYKSKFSNLRFVHLELPQQENSFDCGLFLLHYVELFLEEAPANFSPFKISKFSTFLTVDWFIPSEASFKRCLIRKLIYNLLDDPSQKVPPTSCNMEQRPSVEFLNKHCSPSKTFFDNSTCSLTVKGIEMNLDTIPSPGVLQCDKQERLVMHEFLKPRSNSMSLFQEDVPLQMPKSATSPTKDVAHRNEQLITSNLDGEDHRPVGESLTAQTCSTSYCLKDAGEFETPWSSMQEKEIGLDLLLKTCKHVVSSNRSGEMVKEGSISIEDRGYVSDGPTFGENPGGGGGGEDPKEIDTIKTEEDVSCKISKGVDIATKTIGDDMKHEENNTAAPKGEESEDHQIESTGDDDKQKDSHEISTLEVEALAGKDFQLVDTNNKVDGGKHEDCQENDTHITAERSCQESLPAENSNDIETNADENSLTKDGTQLKRDKPSTKIEVFYQKRRKVLQLDGDRRRTRRFSRDCSGS